jgi:hypothetical protein
VRASRRLDRDDLDNDDLEKMERVIVSVCGSEHDFGRPMVQVVESIVARVCLGLQGAVLNNARIIATNNIGAQNDQCIMCIGGCRA